MNYDEHYFKLWNEYIDLKTLVVKLLYYLDIIEESDEGKTFRPNYIASCRALDAKRMNEILTELKELVK